MHFERSVILSQLHGLSSGTIPKNKVYEWALSVAVSGEFESLADQDPLAASVIHYLLDINRDHLPSVTRKAVVGYYIACLESQEVFRAEDLEKLIARKDFDDDPQSQTQVNDQLHVPQKDSIPEILMKGYVVLFLLASLCVHLIAIIKPDFLTSKDQPILTRVELFLDALPHFIYAIAIGSSLFIVLPRILFYIVFFIAGLGMLFYWYIAIDFVLRQGLSFLALLPLIPVLALPSTFAFIILVKQWFNFSSRAKK